MFPHSVQQIEIGKKIQVLHRECVLQSCSLYKRFSIFKCLLYQNHRTSNHLLMILSTSRDYTSVLKKGLSFLLGDVDILWNPFS